MNYRFTLFHDVLGSRVIDAPGGWEQAILRIERHPEYNSLFDYYEGGFVFYGQNGSVYGGLDFIVEAINTFGPDTTVGFKPEISTDGYVFRALFIGQLDLESIEITQDYTATIPIIRDDFVAKFKNRAETPVDIQSETNLDETTADVFEAYELELSSQVVPMVFDAQSSTMGYELGTETFNDFNYLQMSWDDIELEEFDEYFTLPQAGNTEEPVESFILEYAGEYSFRISTNAWIDISGAYWPISQYLTPYINVNGVETAFDLGTAPGGGPWIADYATWFLDYTVFCPAGSNIKFYFKRILDLPEPGSTIPIRWNGRYVDGPYVFQPRAIITAETVYPITRSNGFFIHDAAAQIIDRITGESETFHSDLLGSPYTAYKQYDEEGCQWNRMIVKGLQLRQYTLEEKPFFQSFKQWWEGANPIFNLGLGIEKISTTKNRVRIENRDFFYNPEIIVTLESISELTKLFDKDYAVKTVRIGYKTWQSENISGIDDPQTKQTRASRFQKMGVEKVLESDFIAASLAIETTRRTTRKKSADYKFDDNTFIISVRPDDLSPQVFEPELDENFESVNNLRNSGTRYNLVLMPVYNFMRWTNVLFGGLQHYLGSVFKFTGGEGNYDVESNYAVSGACDAYSEEISAKENIPVTDQIIHRGEMYRVKGKMDPDTYLDILDNPNNAIGLPVGDTVYPFFIKNLGLPVENWEVEITGWSTEDIPAPVFNTSDFTNKTCLSVDDCDDAYLTEIGDELITEDENCLVLN